MHIKKSRQKQEGKFKFIMKTWKKLERKKISVLEYLSVTGSRFYAEIVVQ